MPWKEQSKMDERLRFVARRLEGESMTDLCREFGISRKTGDMKNDAGSHSNRAPKPSADPNLLPMSHPVQAGSNAAYLFRGTQ